MNDFLPSIKILGTSITTAPKADILEYILKRLQNNKKKFYIVTPNPEILMMASRSKEFQVILNGAAIALPDGIGVLAAGKMLKKSVNKRIAGIDFMLDLCSMCAKEALSIGLLGGSRGVADQVADRLRQKYPNLIVNFVGDEWIQEDKEILNTKYVIPNTHIDILFVAFGAPKQEKWIAKNLADINVTVAMGVGGAFDYISGRVIRAPKIVRSIGMEWAFRLVRQPWRIKRQMMLPVFISKVLVEKFKAL